MAPIPIEIVDNDHEEGIIIKRIVIGDYTIVRGETNSSVKYAVWTVLVETNKNNKIICRKRFSDFETLREQLVKSYPNHVHEIPPLPVKKWIGNLNHVFLTKRQKGLEFFINSIMLNPVFSNSGIVKTFILER